MHVTKVYFMELKMNIGRLYWKKPTFVWIITLAFLGRFLYFLNGNRNDYFTKNQQNLQHRANCVSTLPYVKTSHFEMTVADRCGECFRSNSLFATFAENHLMFIFFYFFCKNFLLVFWRKIFCIFTGFWSRFYLQTQFKTQYI